MRAAELENWTRRVLEAVGRAQTVEDSRVELKSEFPDAAKAARQLAGHANASHAEHVLWIIGADEEAGTVPGVDHGELEQWIPQLEARFDELPPHLLMSLRVPWKEVYVSALLFDASRRPYVIREGDRRLVKWRRGDHTVDATRGDLLRLLVEEAGTPAFEVISGEIVAYPEHDDPWLDLKLELYQERRLPSVAVCPYHRAEIRLLTNYSENEPVVMELVSLIRNVRSETPTGSLTFWPTRVARGQPPPTGSLVASDQLEILGPARVSLHARGVLPSWLAKNYEWVDECQARVSLPVVDAATVVIDVTLQGTNTRPPDPKPGQEQRPKADPRWRWPQIHSGPVQ